MNGDDESSAGLLERIIADPGRPFAMLSRSGDPAAVEVAVGEFSELGQLADLAAFTGSGRALVLVPYRQITERGYRCTDDHSPLLVMAVAEQERRARADVLAALPRTPPLRADELRFDVSDEDHQKIVGAVVTQEIGAGEGSNFVISRSLTGTVGPDALRTALGMFTRLLSDEHGAYWTFLVHTGTTILVGATPEAHLVLEGGVASMNPISGTYRYPAGGPDEAGLLRFLADSKEENELFMVVDEELKMMSAICESGAVVDGPYLKAMGHLAHTEYMLRGRTRLGIAELLRATMFAPTVVGSPLENATRVIARHEAQPRGYYAGVIAYVDRDERGEARMDSAILIRTAVIDESERIRITVGSTVVRDSDPVRETHETSVKAAALVRGPVVAGRPELSGSAAVRASLRRRNADASAFWFADAGSRRIAGVGRFAGRVLLLDAEDNFTAMLATMLRGLGLDVTVAACTDDELAVEEYTLVVLGPGPGDPRMVSEPRVAAIQRRVSELADLGTPFLAVCLSHQILCAMIGLDIDRLPSPNQGLGREIDLFGRRVRVGFYNAYVARSAREVIESPVFGRIEMSTDPETGEVFALRGAVFDSMQFHSESVLSRDGAEVLAGVMGRLAGFARAPCGPEATADRMSERVL